MVALFEVGYQAVHRGQLVVHAMDAFAGAIGVSDSDGKCTPEYIVCDPRSDAVIPEYYALVLRHAARQDFIRITCPAVRERAPRLRYPNLGDMQLPLPTGDEQVAIVRFLDHAERRIDRFIRAKKKLVSLLNEQKQAIIHRAVTRGLDPNVPMKDSGDPWLGAIARDCSLKRLWSISTHRVERTADSLGLLSVFLDRGVIRYDEGGGQVHAPSLDLSNYQVVHPGDFVLNNQQAWRGSVGVSQYHGIISPAYIVLKLTGELHSEYANYLFRCRCLVDQFVAASKGVGDIQRQVFWPFLRRVLVPIPGIDKQARIVRFLESELSNIKAALTRSAHELSLVREYRTRLIADVVTGQLDVREAAASLPDVEPEPADELEADEEVSESEEDGNEAGEAA